MRIFRDLYKAFCFRGNTGDSLIRFALYKVPKSKKECEMSKPANQYETNVALPNNLKAYLKRIEATAINFKRFRVVQETEDGYPTIKCFVKLDATGAIAVSNQDYAPTQEEQDAIALEVKGSKFPRSIGASKSAYESYVRSFKTPPNIYPIMSRKKRGEIICAQSRVENDDGSKSYIIHTLFSDGNWYKLEPDGPLPFFKPEKSASKKIMVHEGAKAAMAAAKISNSKVHPWAKHLSEYEHWGTLGGAKRTPEMDFAEIEDANPEELIYICDNDNVGVQAGRDFSKHISEKRKLFMVRFEVAFPVHFDMADDLPKSFYRGKNYTGPTLLELTKPATWATRQILNEEGKVINVLREQFKREWLHTVQPEFFLHRDFPGRMLTADDFNSEVRPFSDVVRVDNLLRAIPYSKADTMDYMPNQVPGVHNGRDGLVINSYRGSSIEPVKGDPKPWLEYMKGLIPEPLEYDQMLRWCATLIACPEIRMQYSILLISETHGIGKTTLGERILMPLIGRHNTSFPSESELSDSQFNTWCAHKRLVIVNEIYAGNSSKVYQRLKSVVADDETQINQKYISPYRISNWCHVVASSNSLRALKLDNEDRRWFIPEVSEQLRPREYWTTFNQWLTDERGLGIIKHWAADYVKKNGPVSKGEHAPKTQTKALVIVEGFSVGQIAAYRLALTIADKFNKTKEKLLVLDRDVVAYVKKNVHNDNPDRCEKALLLRNAFKAAGWTVGEKNQGLKAWGVSVYEARAMTVDPRLKTPKLGDLDKRGIKPLDLSQFDVI